MRCSSSRRYVTILSCRCPGMTAVISSPSRPPTNGTALTAPLVRATKRSFRFSSKSSVTGAALATRSPPFSPDCCLEAPVGIEQRHLDEDGWTGPTNCAALYLSPSARHLANATIGKFYLHGH